MTENQIKKLRFQMTESLTLESEYQSHFSALDGRVFVVVHTERQRDYGTTGRVHRDYYVDHEHYETREGFENALRKLKL